MNLGEMRTKVRLRAQVPTTDGIWTADFVDAAINEALVQIGLMQPWPWLAATHSEVGDDSGTVDLSAITPPVRDIASVFVGSWEGQPASTDEVDRWLFSERPGFVFAPWGDSLLIRPEPGSDETIQIRYFRDEPALTDDADTPILPERYHIAAVEMACAIGFESLDDESSAVMHERRAMRLIDKMVATALRRARGPHSVRTRSGSQF